MHDVNVALHPGDHVCKANQTGQGGILIQALGHRTSGSQTEESRSVKSWVVKTLEAEHWMGK